MPRSSTPCSRSACRHDRRDGPRPLRGRRRRASTRPCRSRRRDFIGTWIAGLRDLVDELDPADAADPVRARPGARASLGRAVDRQPADLPVDPVARDGRARIALPARGSTSRSASCTRSLPDGWVPDHLTVADALATDYAGATMTDQPAARPPIDQTPEWRALLDHHASIRDRHLRDLFADDPGSAGRLTAEGAGRVPRLLEAPDHRRDRRAARRASRAPPGVEERRDAMFAGEHINTTEDRAVLHTALRAPRR